MSDDPLSKVSEPLGVVLHVAALLARRGDVDLGRELKIAYDDIRQTLCPHDRGVQDVLFMSGAKVQCRRCGLDVWGV